MKILLLAGLCLLAIFSFFNVKSSPQDVSSPLRTPTATQQPCPPFEFDTQVPRPDTRKSYIGRHYDLLNTGLPGYLPAYFGNLMDNPPGYRLIKVPRRNGTSMYWLERVVCRDGTGRPYFEIVDVLVMPRLSRGQDMPYWCYLGDTYIPNVVAIGYLNPRDPTVILNAHVLRPFRRMTSVWYVDPFLKHLTQLNREDVTCYQFVELNPFLTPTIRPTLTARPPTPTPSP